MLFHCLVLNVEFYKIIKSNEVCKEKFFFVCSLFKFQEFLFNNTLLFYSFFNYFLVHLIKNLK